MTHIKFWNIHKCVDIKQHIPEQPMRQWTSLKGNKTHLEKMKIKKKISKVMWCRKKKAVLKIKFITINAYINNNILQINKLTLPFKELEKEPAKLNGNRRQEITKIRAEINEIQTIKSLEKVDETMNLLFEQIFLKLQTFSYTNSE